MDGGFRTFNNLNNSDMLNIIINSQCSKVLTSKNEKELIEFIKAEIEKGTWTKETPCKIDKGGEIIDGGELQDFFNLY